MKCIGLRVKHMKRVLFAENRLRSPGEKEMDGRQKYALWEEKRDRQPDSLAADQLQVLICVQMCPR
jgi:hypothetical protein